MRGCGRHEAVLGRTVCPLALTSDRAPMEAPGRPCHVSDNRELPDISREDTAPMTAALVPAAAGLPAAPD